MLKFFLFLGVFVVLFATAIHGQSLAEFMTITNECRKEANSVEDAVRALTLNQIPQTRNGLCMMACIFKKLGIVGADNKLIVSRALELFSSRTNVDQSKLGTIINTCKAEEITQTDECEAARLITSCVVSKRSQFGI